MAVAKPAKSILNLPIPRGLLLPWHFLHILNRVECEIYAKIFTLFISRVHEMALREHLLLVSEASYPLILQLETHLSIWGTHIIVIP